MKFSEKHKNIIHVATTEHEEGHNHDDFENWLLVEIVDQKHSKKLVFTLDKNPFLHKELFLLNAEFEADAEFFNIGEHYHLLRTQQRQERKSGGDRDRRGGGRDRGFGGGRDRRGGGRSFGGGRDRGSFERRERPEGEGSSEGGERRERSSFGGDRDRRGGGSRDRKGGGSRDRGGDRRGGDRGNSRGRDRGDRGSDRGSKGGFEKSWIERK